MLRRTATLLSLLLAAVLLVAPVTARAQEGGAPDRVVVAGTDVTAGGSWVTAADGTLVTGGASDYNVRYDGAGTLTLRDARLGADGILVEAGQDGTNAGDLALTIVLEGESSIEGDVWLGKDDGAQGKNQGYREQAASTSLAITGDGSLDVTGSLLVHGVRQEGASGGTSLVVSGGARVSVTCPDQHSYPVVINGHRDISVTVDGATLEARSGDGSRGIFSYEPAESPRLVGLNDAIVRTDSLIVDGPAFMLSFEDGILFRGGLGTVSGSVALPHDVSVLPGESLEVDPTSELTIPAGTTLAVEQGATLVNRGTVNVAGTVVRDGTIVCDSHGGGTATCSEQARCALCLAPYGELGDHVWGEPAWAWSEDLASCTATLTCQADASHEESLPATVTVAVEREPSCTEEGVMRHDATVTFGGVEYATSTTAPIPAEGHDYVDGVCTVCGEKESSVPVPDEGEGTDGPAVPATDDGNDGDAAARVEPAASVLPATGETGVTSAAACVALGAVVLAAGLGVRREG